MSIISSGISHTLQFYLSGAAPCPYLEGQMERKLFTRLGDDDNDLNAEINSTLCRAGFRRSHNVIYRPACTSCSACTPVRIPVKLFTPSRSLRRVLRNNQDLHWGQAPAIATDELFTLFSAYQKSRHSDSDMALMTAEDFAAMLKEGSADTHLYLLRDATNSLKGCIISDHVGDGISAVYSFFDPNEAARSLGSLLVLSLIAEADRRNLSFIYLGYWVEESRKMTYKTRFAPLQALKLNGWDWLD